jgi:penicillin V acylase-like amidase (Ntn superfamily)
VAGVLSGQRNVAKPLGRSGTDQTELSQTYWMTVIDHRRRRYYFEDTLTPDVFWVDLEALDFAGSAPSRTLSQADHPFLPGEVSAPFEVAIPLSSCAGAAEPPTRLARRPDPGVCLNA